MTICIDFDGTCVTHEFPSVGKNIGSVPVLQDLVAKGHKLILFTMRSNRSEQENYLTDAVNWFKDNNIELFGINTNPHQSSWTSSPKAYAELYIDDASLGIPLKLDFSKSKRPFVDWSKVATLLEKRGIL